MFERTQIEKILESHGVTPTAPDEEIKAVLIAAKWNKEDVDTAIYVLRDSPEKQDPHVDALHKLYRTDERLKPETVKALLGIDMEMTSDDIVVSDKRARGGITIKQMLHIAVVSALLGVILLIGAMLTMQVGIFHQTLSL